MAGRDVVWPGDAQYNRSTFCGLGFAANNKRQNCDLWLDVYAGNTIVRSWEDDVFEECEIVFEKFITRQGGV